MKRSDIHNVKAGDLVRRIAYHDSNQSDEVFLVLDVIGDYLGRASHTHCMTLKVYQILGLPARGINFQDKRGDVPMNMYEIV